MLDSTATGEETIDLLRRYLMMETTNPPGNETSGARFIVSEKTGLPLRLTARSAPGHLAGTPRCC